MSHFESFHRISAAFTEYKIRRYQSCRLRMTPSIMWTTLATNDQPGNGHVFELRNTRGEGNAHETQHLGIARHLELQGQGKLQKMMFFLK